jgi:hypothetical protein
MRGRGNSYRLSLNDLVEIRLAGRREHHFVVVAVRPDLRVVAEQILATASAAAADVLLLVPPLATHTLDATVRAPPFVNSSFATMG